MTSENSPDNSDKSKEYLNSYSATTYLSELDTHLKHIETLQDTGEKLFYFNTVIKQIITNAMFEYDRCKTELDELYWRFTFSCHPGEETVIKTEIARVRENLKDLEKVFVKAKQNQPQI